MPLTNSQYDKIMRDYEEKQLANRAALARCTEEAYSKIPELAKLDEAIADLAVERVHSLLSQSSSHPSRSIHELTGRRKQLLADYGYPENFLDPTYTCPFCNDTGYVDSRKCVCFKKAAVELLYLQSNLIGVLDRENFSNFDLSLYSKTHIDEQSKRSSYDMMKSAYDTCQNYIANFGNTPVENLFFYGDAGVGKTFLSNCIAKELISKSYSVIYFSASKLFEVLAKSHFEKDSNAQDMDEYIYDCDLLIIDDLGTELTNAFVSSQLFTCINERYARQKSIIISTNLSLSSLMDIYSERIFSRIISNYTLLKITGDDIRIKKKMQNKEI